MAAGNNVRINKEAGYIAARMAGDSGGFAAYGAKAEMVVFKTMIPHRKSGQMLSTTTLEPERYKGVRSWMIHANDPDIRSIEYGHHLIYYGNPTDEEVRGIRVMNRAYDRLKRGIG